MNHIFDLKISPYTGTAEVLLDGQPLSPQSQLQACAIGHISNWYRDLPDLLYCELNDEYSVRLHCLDIEYVLLTAVLGVRKECSQILHVPIACRYDVRTRCQWLKEAASLMRAGLPDMPFFSVLSMPDTDGDKAYILGKLDPHTRSRYSDSRQNINVIIASPAGYAAGKSLVSSDKDVIFVIDKTGAGMAVELERCFAVRADLDRAASLIREWIDLALFYPYLMYGHSLLSPSAAGAPFDARARIRMLTREEPVVESGMPARLECGHSTAISLKEFPASGLKARSCDPSVAEIRNNAVRALKAGTTQIEILSESGQTVCSHALNVYFVPRVTSISLSMPGGNTVLEGSQFQIGAAYTPAGAVNISSGKWTVSPAGALQPQGSGVFKALSPGQITVTLEVEKVTKSITVQVMPLTRDIKMETVFKMRVNAPPAAFHAALEPAGSGCGGLQVRIRDAGVAKWDAYSKTISPVSEGSTVLEISLVNAAGAVYFRKDCRIIILPEKDIITPWTLPTLLVVCAILSVITAGTQMGPLSSLAGLVISAAEILLNIRPVLNKVHTKQNSTELVIGLAGAVIFSAALCFYLSGS